jgi:hypothetical protein
MTSCTGEQRPARTHATVEPLLLLEQRRRVYTGEIVASATPMLLQTILGSCVAVCLRDPVACIGGMNHILLSAKCAGDESPFALQSPCHGVVNQRDHERGRRPAKAGGQGVWGGEVTLF